MSVLVSQFIFWSLVAIAVTSALLANWVGKR